MRTILIDREGVIFPHKEAALGILAVEVVDPSSGLTIAMDGDEVDQHLLNTLMDAGISRYYLEG